MEEFCEAQHASVDLFPIRHFCILHLEPFGLAISNKSSEQAKVMFITDNVFSFVIKINLDIKMKSLFFSSCLQVLKYLKFRETTNCLLTGCRNQERRTDKTSHKRKENIGDVENVFIIIYFSEMLFHCHHFEFAEIAQ